MKYRKLRIAWSIGCGILCLLLIALWARSYWWSDGIRVYHAPMSIAQLKSFGAAVHLYFGHYSGNDSGVKVFSVRATRIPDSRFDWKPFPECRASLPHYFLLLVVGAVATVPWVLPRFSLRTLLIVTTLVAVVLGLIVAAM